MPKLPTRPLREPGRQAELRPARTREPPPRGARRARAGSRARSRTGTCRGTRTSACPSGGRSRPRAARARRAGVPAPRRGIRAPTRAWPRAARTPPSPARARRPSRRRTTGSHARAARASARGSRQAQTARPPRIARRRSAYSSLRVLLGLPGRAPPLGLLLVDPLQAGAQVVDDEAGRRLRPRRRGDRAVTLAERRRGRLRRAPPRHASRRPPKDGAPRPRRAARRADRRQGVALVTRRMRARTRQRPTRPRARPGTRARRAQPAPGSRPSGDATTVSRQRGRERRAARARWECSAFQASPSSATVVDSPPGRRSGRTRIPRLPRGSPAISPSSVPVARPPSRRGRATTSSQT